MMNNYFTELRTSPPPCIYNPSDLAKAHGFDRRQEYEYNTAVEKYKKSNWLVKLFTRKPMPWHFPKE